MKKRLQAPIDFDKQKRMACVSLGIAILAQVLVLLAYYFKEKQVILAMPMVIGIIVTVHGFINVLHLRQDD